jgi:hypothetical protein
MGLGKQAEVGVGEVDDELPEESRSVGPRAHPSLEVPRAKKLNEFKWILSPRAAW